MTTTTTDIAPSRTRRRTKAAATLALLTTAVLAAGFGLAGAASAHVKVSGIDAVQGGYGVVTFRVPSESATASTTQLLITFPRTTPFVSAELQPKAGWTQKVIMKKLAKPMKNDDGDEIDEYVSQVDFKADNAASAIPPGEFDMFNISVGAFPDAPSVSFAALQYYSDGSTVNWDERSVNGAEPEHPAPTLQLAAANDAAGTSASAGSTPSQATTMNMSAQSNSSTNWPGIVGLIVGGLALLVSIAVLLLTRARAQTADRVGRATGV